MSLEKDFVPYQESMEVKELGFNEPCFGRYYYKESYPMLNPHSEETEVVFEFYGSTNLFYKISIQIVSYRNQNKSSNIWKIHGKRI